GRRPSRCAPPRKSFILVDLSSILIRDHGKCSWTIPPPNVGGPASCRDACTRRGQRLYKDCPRNRPSPRRATMTRTVLKEQLQKDRTEYLLVQFVDLHGSPKVKMVPADYLDDALDTGAGFAGGAVWGLGQNASSHDMMARVDPASYTPLPWK